MRQVDAANEATQELLPGAYERHVAAPDEHMAQRLRTVCKSVPLGPEGAPVGTVVAVVGAQHVPGLQRRLANTARNGLSTHGRGGG